MSDPTPEKRRTLSQTALLKTKTKQERSHSARKTSLTDGGSSNNGNENSEENNNDRDTEEQNDNGGGDDTDGEESANEEGTRILYLDVEGLFLDVLGLEVDLDEVVLDVSAVSGSGNLLGNLLSAVSGVLDTSLSDVIDGLLPDDILSEVLPDDLVDISISDRFPSFSDVVFGFINSFLDMLLEAIESEESDEESSSDSQQS